MIHNHLEYCGSSEIPQLMNFGRMRAFRFRPERSIAWSLRYVDVVDESLRDPPVSRFCPDRNPWGMVAMPRPTGGY